MNRKKYCIAILIPFFLIIAEKGYCQITTGKNSTISPLKYTGWKVENLSQDEYSVERKDDILTGVSINKKTAKTVGVIGNEFEINKSKGAIKLSGILNLKAIIGESSAGLYCTATDSKKNIIVFNNLSDWKLRADGKDQKIAIEIPFDKPISKISWGVYVSGVGIIKAGSLSIEISDGEFGPDWDSSALGQLNQQSSSTEMLGNFGKFWGFLKYYHPAVNQGKLDWDSMLVSNISNIIHAKSAKQYNAIVGNILQKLGPVAKCDTCSKLTPDSLLINYDFKFVNSSLLSQSNREKIRYIKNNYRPVKSYYISFSSRGTPNPEFAAEKAYRQMSLPNLEYRLLTLFRYWNAINYYYPYKYAIGKDWDQVVNILIPTFVKARTLQEFQKAILLMNSAINDSHASSVLGISPFLLPTIIWDDRSLKSEAMTLLPLNIKRIQNNNIVMEIDSSFSVLTGVKKGDFVSKINGYLLDSLSRIYHDYISGSTISSKDVTVFNNRLLSVTFAKKNDNHLTIEYTGKSGKKKVEVTYNQSEYVNFLRRGLQKDFSEKDKSIGYRMVSDSVLYVDPSKFDSIAYTNISKNLSAYKAIIIDFRVYPKYYIGNLLPILTRENKPGVKFQWMNPELPGVMAAPSTQYFNSSATQNYNGKTIVLIDENSISQSEFWAMQFKNCSPGSLAIGRSTVGADGDVSNLVLPGRYTVYFSGIRINYPNGKETQRVGIQPDIKIDFKSEDVVSNVDGILNAAIKAAQ